MRHIQSRRDKSNYYDHPLKRRGVATAKRARAKRINVKDTLFVLSQMWNIHNQKKKKCDIPFHREQHQAVTATMNSRD